MSRLFLAAIKDLAERYRQVFVVSWADRHQLSAGPRPSHETAFLPAHLEITETPIHPLPHWTMRIIGGATLLVLLVSILGKLDIVVAAKGELIPDSSVKVVQPAMTGVVRSILVHDGDRVVVGQPLVILDTRQAVADAMAARAARVRAALAVARAQALLDAVARDSPPVVTDVADATPAEREPSARLAVQTWNAFVDKRDDARSRLRASEAERDGVRREIEKLQATAPLARRQADQYRQLATDGDVASSEYLDKEQAALNQEHDIVVKRSRIDELSSMVEEERAALANITSEFLRDQRIDLEKNTQLRTESGSSETKALAREALLTLRAPVDGTVQQLGIHTLGGVVTAAQAIMDVVPNDTLLVKSTIDNKDIGFVREGQDVAVKVAAYPYTHYGYIRGRVTEVSNDAAADRRRGSVFVAYVRLDRNYIVADGRRVPLTSGMGVTAEIRTGERRVISYFLAPLLRSVHESLRER